jgi:hypothetical protein
MFGKRDTVGTTDPLFLDKAGAFSYTSTAVKPQSLSIRGASVVRD